MKPSNKRATGFTLLELVIAITLLGFGVSAFIVLINQTTRDSVDPMVRQQAGAIAQAYMDEVLANAFCDPDFSSDCRTDCTSSTVCSACSGGEGSRLVFDDVCDYNGISDNGARDRTDSPIAGLENFNIEVAVDDGSDGTAVTIDGLSSANGQALRVDVRVTHDSFSELNHVLSGFRVNF